jgi:hypothetical protein
LFEITQHVGHCLGVASAAREHVMRNRPAVDQNQADQNLRIARLAVPAVAIGADLGRPLTLEIGRGQVVEHRSTALAVMARKRQIEAPMNGFVVRTALRQHPPLRASVEDENPQHSFEHKAGRDRLAPRIAADDAGQMAIAAAGPVSGQPLLWRTAITLTSIFRHTASMEFATVNDKTNEEGRRNAWPFLACYRCCDRSGCGDWFWA